MNVCLKTGLHFNGLHKQPFPLFYLEGFLLHARFLPFSLWRFYFFPSLVPQEHSSLTPEGFIFSFTCSTGTSFSILKVSFIHHYNAIRLCLFPPSSWYRIIEGFIFLSFICNAWCITNIEGQSVLSLYQDSPSNTIIKILFYDWNRPEAQSSKNTIDGTWMCLDSSINTYAHKLILYFIITFLTLLHFHHRLRCCSIILL